LETKGKFTKARCWRAFPADPRAPKGKADCLAGDAVLIAPVSPPNSLLTGNFTGNFAKSDLQDGFILQETPVLQPFLSLFPTQKNGGKIRMIREIFQNNRE
jgi:hypothetical protein